MELQDLIRQHGKSVAFVFKQMGLNNPVTVKDVMLVTLMYGPAFVDAVAMQVAKDTGYSNYDGSPDEATWIGWLQGDPDAPDAGSDLAQPKTEPEINISATKKAAKTSAPGKVWGVLNNILTAVGSYTGARSAAKNKGGIGAGTIKDFGKDDNSDNNKPTAKTTNYLLYAGLAIIVVLFIIVMFKNHKK